MMSAFDHHVPRQPGEGMLQQDYDDVADSDDGVDSDDGSSFHSEGEELAEYWDPYLYQLQQKAPRPIRLRCPRVIDDRPPFYGDEYHGAITREETARLLGVDDGNYLVRKGLSQSGTYSLSFVFSGNVRHYHLHYDHATRQHYVGEKTFDEIDDLVADGLITLYMEANNVEEYLQSARRKKSTNTLPTASLLDRIRQEDTGNGVPSTPPPPIPPRGPRHSMLLQPDPDSTGMGPGAAVGVDPIYDETARKEQTLYSFHYEKPHNFKVHHYLTLPWCDYCRNFMWGLTAQGYKCKDCGYNAHKQCKDSAPPDCQPSLQLVKRMYGVDLTTVVKMCNTKVPVIVTNCIQEIENRGLDVEGLYRISGQTADIVRVKNHFDQEMGAPLESFNDIHCITGALKLFIRELPIPLITFDCFDLCLIAARCSTQAETVDTIRVVLSRLPPSHLNTLRYIMRHLHKVARHKAQNKMDSKNLALVFAPSLMRPAAQFDQLSAMTKVPEQKKVTELLISRYSTFF